MHAHLACDATAIKFPMTGVQNAVLRQVMAMTKALAEDNLTTTLFAPPLEEFVNLPDNASLNPKAPRTGKPWRRIIWQQLILPRLLRKMNADCLHAFAYTAPWNCPVPYVLNVHDLIPLTHPHLCANLNRWQIRTLLPHSIQKAHMNLVSTNHGADCMKHLLGIPNERIQVINLGVDGDFFSTPAPYPDNLPPGLPYILFLSNIEPKKDLDTLLDAYALAAPHITDHLVIAGRQAWKARKTCQRIRHWNGPGTVHWLHYVPQDQLPALYQHARAFVMPSIIEGFGLPILEAMAAGTPVIHSDHPALLETAAGAGLSFSVGNAQQLARLLRRLLASPDLQAECREAGMAHAANMSWNNWGTHAADIIRHCTHS